MQELAILLPLLHLTRIQDQLVSQTEVVLDDGKLTQRHVLRSHQKPVSFVAWSPDDTMLLTCGNIEVLNLWDVETGTCKHTYGDAGFIISSCAWFPDSKRFVCGSSDPEKGIYMWDCEGNEIRSWKGMRMPKVLDLAITADGEKLISKWLSPLKFKGHRQHKYVIRSCFGGLDSTFIASGSEDSKVCSFINASIPAPRRPKKNNTPFVL
ncbi:WD repeat-containing protein WDS homolog isoform X2 [Capsicum annuum]|uniref:WD repeat-containing protein WDS homolog isoform X2 n=1 Tax=Capsicum annuum TaxID=4072 RepID=UPI001FB0C076|nr:WD repeat-containing protein WDS homolog isoform X2 [Capsicum annuum]